MRGLGLISLFLLIVASGCATTQKPMPPSGGAKPVELAEARDADLEKFANWSVEGRLGVQLPDDGFTAAISWQQRGEAYNVAIIDPLGRQVAKLQGDFQHAILKLSDGRVFEASDPDELMQKNLGWSLPVKSLIYWVRGLPDPQKVAWRREYDGHGRLKVLEQGGWTVKFSRYIESQTSQAMFPALTRLSYEDFKIKLLIKEWK